MSAIGRPALDGTGGAGTKLKREIVKRAAEQSERIYAAMVRQQQSPVENEKFRRKDVIFDPTRFMQNDWEQVLAKVAGKRSAAKTKCLERNTKSDKGKPPLRSG